MIYLLDEDGNPITDGIEPITLGEDAAFSFIEGATTVLASHRQSVFYPVRQTSFVAPARVDTFYA